MNRSYLQVYLDTEKEAFTVSDYAIAPPSAYTRTYTVTLQANEGTKDDPNWVNVLPLTRQFTVAKESFRAHGEGRPGSE